MHKCSMCVHRLLKSTLRVRARTLSHPTNEGSDVRFFCIPRFVALLPLKYTQRPRQESLNQQNGVLRHQRCCGGTRDRRIDVTEKLA